MPTPAAVGAEQGPPLPPDQLLCGPRTCPFPAAHGPAAADPGICWQVGGRGTQPGEGTAVPPGCCHGCGIAPSHREWMGKGLCWDFAPHPRVCSPCAAPQQLCACADSRGQLSTWPWPGEKRSPPPASVGFPWGFYRLGRHPALAATTCARERAPTSGITAADCYMDQQLGEASTGTLMGICNVSREHLGTAMAREAGTAHRSPAPQAQPCAQHSTTCSGSGGGACAPSRHRD